MAIRSGDLKTLRDAAVYGATATWYECTNSIRMGSEANTLILYVESSVASPGDVDFKIAHSPDNDKTSGGGNFYELCAAAETPEVYGPIGFTAAGQLRSIVVPGLVPREDIKVYFRASANASSAKIKIRAMSIMSEAGISQSEVSIGDIEVDLESVTENEDVALEAAQPGIVQTVKAANFDGSALTTGAVGTEGDAVIPKSSLYGVGYVMPVTEDGASTPLIAHDEAVAGGVGATTLAVSYNSQEFDGSAIAAVNTELDAVKPSASLYGITYTMPVTENGASTPLIAHDEAVAGGVGGTTISISYNSQVFDGSALSGVGTELDAVKPSASLQGVSFIAPITPTGADSAIAVHDTAISAAAGGTAGIVPVVEAKTVDGNALPNSVSEGDVVRPAASIAGVGLQTLTSQAGTGTAVVDHDTAIASGEGTAVVMAGGIAQTIDGSALPGASGAEGDATHLAVSASGVQYQTVTNVGATQTAVIDIDAAPASGIGGAVVMSGYVAKDFDGAAIPAAAGTEGDAAAAAVSLSGVSFVMPVSEDGSEKPYVQHAAAIDAASGGTIGQIAYAEYEALGALDSTNVVVGDATRLKSTADGVLYVRHTDGTYTLATMDANSRAGFVKITDGTDEADVIVQDAAFGTGSKGLPLFGKYEATPATYHDGDAVPVALDSNGRVKLSDVDIEIGAVELKNATSDDRALISDANTARAATDHVISVQQLAADGTVPPSGSANTNAPFIKLTDAGVDADLIATSAAAQPTSVLGVAGEVVDFDTAGTDYTAAIGILGASATGAKPIITDTDGHLQIDVLTSSGQYTDDSAGFTIASSSGSAIMAVATSDSVDSGDVGALRMTVKRNVGTDLASIGGTDVAAGAAAMAASLPVTLATDDTHFGAVGMASDVDGATHGQLRYIGEYVDNIPVQGSAAMAGSLPVTLATDDTHLGAVGMASDVDGAIHGQLRYIGDYVDNIPVQGTAAMVGSIPVTLASDDVISLAIKAAVEIIDDWDDGADNCKTVHGYAPVVTSATGTSSGTIATTGALAYNFQLENITIKLSSDGTMAAAETFKVVLNAKAALGAAYDTDLASWVPASEGNPTSLVYIPESPLVCESGDAIDITLSANTGGDTYAIRIVTRRI